MQKITLLALTATIMLAVGCVKNTDEFVEYISIDSYFDSAEDVGAVTTFTAEDGLTYTSDTGVKIEVPPSALNDGNGKSVTGLVAVHFTILTDIADLIRYNFNTEGVNGLLDAHSVAYLSFSQQGKSLSTNADNKPTVYMPYNLPSDGALLYSLSDSGWLQISDGESSALLPTVYTINTDGAPQDIRGYKIQPTVLGWLNVAEPLAANDGSYTICAQLPEDHNNVNSVVYGSLDGYTSLLSMVYKSEKMLFCGEIVNPAPGSSILLIAISDQGNTGQYNFGTKSAILESSTTELIRPVLKSQAEIDEILEDL